VIRTDIRPITRTQAKITTQWTEKANCVAAKENLL
jgi:hypothetical protein